MDPPADGGRSTDATSDATSDATTDSARPDAAGDAAGDDASPDADASAPDAADASLDAPADASPDAADADASAPTGASWMSCLAGSTSLAALTIPGTHDTGARLETSPGTLKCQELTVPNQLAAGVRYLDIRTRNVSNKFEIYHTTLDQNLSFDEVLQNIADFFASHPGEAIVMSLKEEQPAQSSTNTYEQTFDAYVAAAPQRWYLGATIPTLDQARGKIVLLRRFAATTTPKGLDGTAWADNTTFTIDNAAKLRIQDFYEFSDNDAKWTAIDGLLSEAKAGALTTMYLNNTSGYQPLDGGVEDIPSVSNFVNPKLTTYFTTNTSGRYGIIAMDFADAAKCSLIFGTNFH